MHRNHIHRNLQERVSQHAQNSDSNSFFNLLTSPELLQIVEDSLPEHRERLYHPTATLSMFLSQAMNADASCQNVVDEMAVNRVLDGLSGCSTKTGGYCRARQRLPTTMVSELAQQAGALIVNRVPSAWLWQGRPIKLVDGTTVSMPDTEENQSVYPQPSTQQPGVGFPLARVVAVICLSSGAVLNAAMGPYHGKSTGEMSLLMRLLESFQPGDIVMADRYFPSYFLIATLLERGVDIVMQQHAARKTDFRRGQRLGAHDHRVEWVKPNVKPHWMSAEDFDSFPESIAMREVKVVNKILVTTLLSTKEAPKRALNTLYWDRWHIELDLRNIKSTLGLDILRCKTPEMIEKELWVYLLAYNLIRLVMAAAAWHAQVLPRQLSFKHSLQMWISWSRQQFRAKANENTEALFEMIAAIRVGNRPGRIEPRAVKRRPKAYPWLNEPRPVARARIRKYGHPK
jgi:DDE family transposase